MASIEQIKKTAHQIRLQILASAYGAGRNGAHLGGGLSLAEILSTLYLSILKYDKNFPLDKSRDRLILSKGHGAIALFAILQKAGFISAEELNDFEQNGSPYYAHAFRNVEKGIEFSGGSLSLGLSFAVGVALANQRDHINNHIYVIVGDGECDEGLVWEALMSSAHFNLTNLTVIIDCNGLQSDDFTKNVMNIHSLSEKFTSFGFYTQEVDGHDVEKLCETFASRNFSRPNAIIAHTIKGKGVSFIENNREWHHGVLSLNQYEMALKELEVYGDY